VNPARRPALIERRLYSNLEATHVEVMDDSQLHAGHLGAEGGGGHFRVVVVSPRFEGVSRLEAQRMVYRALGDLMDGAIHAIQIQTLTPAAWHQLRGT
jgi:BolA protein